MKKLLNFLFLILLFVGCGKEKGVEKTSTVVSTPNKLIYTQSSESVTLHPHEATDVYSRRIIANIFDRLIETDESLNIVPGLAESWEQLSPTELKFNLKKGVKFQNGDEFTSEDVKYTFENAKKSPKVGTLYSAIESVETPDKYTAIVKTDAPSGSLIHHLTHITASILNKNYYENTKDTNHSPMGTGAYSLAEWKPGSYMTLKRNDEYFRGKPAIEIIEVKPIPEENSRVIAVETGEHHITGDIDSIGRKILGDREDVRVEEISSLGVGYLGVNTSKGALQDKRVRQAIAMGINRDLMIEAVLSGAVEKANSILGPGVVGYSKETKPFDYNPEEAKKLLAEAGVENLELVLATSNNELRKQMAEIIQAQLKEIGINVKIEILEWAAFLNATATGKCDIFMLGWSNSSGDADYGMGSMLHSSMMGSSGNRSFFNNPEFDALLNAGKVELDSAKRAALYKEAQDIMNEEVPILPIYFMPASAGIRKEVKGFVQSPINNPTFYKLSF
ncbi:ABC transporter substrate-binding protein [Cetobacterium sp.]|uniref:ABC transporter substrate-binding protein n=1 Tax=Cetobacterium sp. TaxID=2071632 RepID=UPI003EE7433A